MEDWVYRALQRWPNVPALYGWLKLDRRGRWLIKNEIISRPQIIDVINNNYAADEQGRWYFQNGPQRGYMQLERAPLLLSAMHPDKSLRTHTGLRVEEPTEILMDENGGIFFQTEHGAAALLDDELEWALAHMSVESRAVTEEQIADALQLTSGTMTAVAFTLQSKQLRIRRIDAIAAPTYLRFVSDPQPS
jgi:hypothetical protein